MGKIVLNENISLDGVFEDPTGEERVKRGGRFDQFLDKDREAWAEVESSDALGAEALHLGRRSDEYFGARWSSRRGEWADRLNSLPKYVASKYVASSTFVDPAWDNSMVLKGDVLAIQRSSVWSPPS